MPKTLTLTRESDRDTIYIPIHVFDVGYTKSGELAAELDTGNDHTCIRQNVFDAIGLVADGRMIQVNGVTGGAAGRTARISIGIETANGHKIKISNHEVVVLPTMTCNVLFGRDMLEFFDVAITRGGTTVLTFD
ncbi:retroviral-like aspartic protease family protein [Sinorhizobium sp. BJ1]|uniref:retroviral-like aspartic protease family protein n=1 Tax=Sinorhizobium sp. BJ1 TaxID=2035455 RepID=UPI0015CF4464|nr:retroviral-like aspartic protease family protein [Sinorhizobium sp. BJ1]